MTDNIVQMPTPKHVLADRIKKGHERSRIGRAEWIEGMTDESIALAESRDQFPSNTEFGLWLVDNGLDYWGKDDRAGMINLAKAAKHRADLVFIFEQFSEDRWKPDTIWRAFQQKRWEWVKDRFTEMSSDDPNTTPEVPQVVKLHEKAPVEQPAATSPISESTSKEVLPPRTNLIEAIRKNPNANQRDAAVALGVSLGTYQRTRSRVLGTVRLTSLRGWERAEELLAFYRHPTTQSLINRIPQTPGGKQIWKFLMDALDTGLLLHNDLVIKQLTARLLFPHGSMRAGNFCCGFDLTKASARNIVATDLLPLMIANKDALFAAPDDIEQILNRARRKQSSERQATAIASRANKAIAALPAHESEVIMFGKRLWPIVEGETFGTYDFLTLQTAVWKFTDLNRWLHRDSPVSRAIMIRNSTKWDRHLIGELVKGTDAAIKIERIYSLVHTICSLMEQNPDGECKEPLTPLVLG